MATQAIDILDKFSDFIDSKSILYDNENIDMTTLVNQFRNTTPIEVTMLHPATHDFYSGMAAAIVLNLCQNPLNREYPWHGLQKIKRIIEKDHCEDNCAEVQLQLLIHLTKMNLIASKSAHYVGNFEQMVYHNPTEDWSKTWLDLAKRTVSNKSILKSINALINRIFGIESERNERTVGVRLVDTTETDLRGFSGFDCIYINFAHFDSKRYTQRKFSDCEIILAIDVITLVLHEYSHVRIRQIVNDINMSTPTKIPRQSTVEDLEFGRITERYYFGAAPDWIKSLNRGTESAKRLLKFAESFIGAIRTNKEVPAFPLGVTLENRAGVVTMGGADITTEYHIE